jgi:hypothetical protein
MGNSSPNKIGLDEQIPESVHLELLSSIIPRLLTNTHSLSLIFIYKLIINI